MQQNVPVTARPYAAARCADDSKISTVVITATNWNSVMTGMKIWPRTFTEVCTTRMRGSRPSCTAWRDSENAPVITAWLAMTVAAVMPLPEGMSELTFAGALAGVAGHMAALTDAFVSPELLGWHRSAEALLMVLLGGIGALHGPILGALALTAIQEIGQTLTERQRLVEGLAILAAVLLLRRGLAGLGRR